MIESVGFWEETYANAWSAFDHLLHDDWFLRFARGYLCDLAGQIDRKGVDKMTDSVPEPVILDSLEDTIFRAMSVLAGMQLDLFTPLKDGPLSANQIAASIGVETTKLRPLL